MKILAFAGSSSTQSINKKLVTWTSTLFAEHDIDLVDLNDFEVPVYSMDKEEATGIPELIQVFSKKIADTDLILLSMAEHNGAYSAAFKNIFDWTSRIPDTTVFQEKPIFLLATSPGGRGGSSVLEIAAARFPFNGGKVLETFSLPAFYDNFDQEKGITDEAKLEELKDKIEKVKSSF